MRQSPKSPNLATRYNREARGEFGMATQSQALPRCATANRFHGEDSGYGFPADALFPPRTTVSPFARRFSRPLVKYPHPQTSGQDMPGVQTPNGQPTWASVTLTFACSAVCQIYWIPATSQLCRGRICSKEVRSLVWDLARAC